MLQKDDVRLRILSETDLNQIMTWVNDQEVNNFITRVLPMSREAELQWINSLIGSTTDVVLGICYVENGKETLIGTCGLHHIDWINRNATLGIVIGIKSYWNHNCGSKALFLLIKYAFDQLNMHRLSSSAFDENEGSIALQKKCGLVEEGRRREALFRHGKFYDEVLFGLLRADYIISLSD